VHVFFGLLAHLLLNGFVLLPLVLCEGGLNLLVTFGADGFYFAAFAPDDGRKCPQGPLSFAGARRSLSLPVMASTVNVSIEIRRLSN
jgi:hypothetical protein